MTARCALHPDRAVRGRGLGVLALCAGSATLLGSCCPRASIPLGIWGLILLTDGEVRVRFEERERRAAI
ncbi:MAG TPA: hypothetical protein RMH99_26410 [Sandaracinaceae bacterium LLY-WYZ-13_1]|nr:hypothetical protein [Sandaracinaceae bacterium LLY-WYZ-13_1]